MDTRVLKMYKCYVSAIKKNTLLQNQSNSVFDTTLFFKLEKSPKYLTL